MLDASPVYTILILDDNDVDRAVCRRYLGKSAEARFEIFDAQTIREAQDLLDKYGGFDCCLVDYQLPDGDGIDFARDVMARGGGIRIPAIIMITGHGSEEIAARAFKGGAADYLTKKDISGGYLLQPVLGSIEKSRLRTELRLSRAALERSNRELGDFAHTASHDLKAPLRRIRQYCDVLREEAAPRLTDADREILDRMTVNATRMQALIDGLLAYARVTTETEERSPASLRALADDVVAEMKQDPACTDVRFDIGDMPEIPCYALKIRQLLANLVGNAVKYRAAAPLLVQIGARTDESGTVTVWVRDNGMGIAPQFHKDIFGEFKRLHARDKIEGTGLGLPICRKIVELHGGRIWVESEEGAGAAFYFTLPPSGAAG